MRRIILARHGQPDFPVGAHLCLGRTDLPLSPLGRMQAALLDAELRSLKLKAVFSSPLLRCCRMADAFGQPFVLEEDLIEQDMGCWDGLDFETIKLRFPALYEARGQNPLLVPAGAETLAQVQARAVSALQRCADTCCGDFVVVTHASVIQAILASVLQVPLAESRKLRLPYGAYTVLLWKDGFHVETEKRSPDPEMTPILAEMLLAAAAPGQRVEAHCRAVAKKAGEIADALPLTLDRNALICAALLHDVARKERNHATVGADWVETLGYGIEAGLIRQHHDLESNVLDEAAILYLSDKCVQEDKPVSIEERFENSTARCMTAEAKEAHVRRYTAVKALQAKVNTLCGRSVIL